MTEIILNLTTTKENKSSIMWLYIYQIKGSSKGFEKFFRFLAQINKDEKLKEMFYNKYIDNDYNIVKTLREVGNIDIRDVEEDLEDIKNNCSLEARHITDFLDNTSIRVIDDLLEEFEKINKNRKTKDSGIFVKGILEKEGDLVIYVIDRNFIEKNNILERLYEKIVKYLHPQNKEIVYNSIIPNKKKINFEYVNWLVIFYNFLREVFEKDRIENIFIVIHYD